MLFLAGEHTLEVLGGEGCCDGTTSWSFSYRYGDWQEVSIENLENLKYEPGPI